MKKLSDYKGEEAIELWADLLEPISKILSDKEIANMAKGKQPKILIAKAIVKNHVKEASEILTRIDDSPIDGLNVVLRLVSIISEIGEHEELQYFFGFAEQKKTDNESFGSATVNTEEEEN